ncbi:anti-sigma factor [Nocardia sp. NPDC004722]
MSVAARAEMLPMLRSVVETVLLTADFTLDAVADVRVAIDEVVTALVVAADGGGEVACAIEYDRRGVEVRMSAPTRSADVLPKNSLSRHLLETMVDVHSIDYRADGRPDTYRMVVHFGRRRTGDLGW